MKIVYGVLLMTLCLMVSGVAKITIDAETGDRIIHEKIVDKDGKTVGLKEIRMPNPGEFETAVAKYFEVSGHVEASKQAITQMMTTLGARLDEEHLEKLKKALNHEDLVKRLIPVYMEYFTLDEVNEMIAFYESPVGKKLASKTPELTLEGMRIGEAWAADAMKKAGILY